MKYWMVSISSTYTPRLYGKLDIVAGSQLNIALGLGEVKENLFNHIGAFNKTKRFLHRADNAAILNRLGRILQAYMAGAQVASASGQ